MIYKLFLLSFVFFFMLINDNHSVQAQERYCRTTGCTSRTTEQVFDQCRQVYGSNRIRSEPCGGGLNRYRCCTSMNFRDPNLDEPNLLAQSTCLDLNCLSTFDEATEACREQLRERFGNVPDFRIFGTGTCDGGLVRFQCCTRV